MHVHVFDVLVVGVAVAAELEIVLRDLAGPRWLLLSAVWLYTLPLLARRRWPLAAPVFVICLQVLTSFVDVPGSVRESMGVVAYVLAFWVLASHNPLREAVLGLMVGLAGIVMVTLEDPRVLPREAVIVAVYASLTWLAGVALRQRNVRVARAEDRSAALERDHRDAQAAVAEERARIARELHDVVAHSVSVMAVQAGGGAQMLTTDRPGGGTAARGRGDRPPGAGRAAPPAVHPAPGPGPRGLAPQPDSRHLPRARGVGPGDRTAGRPGDRRRRPSRCHPAWGSPRTGSCRRP